MSDLLGRILTRLDLPDAIFSGDEVRRWPAGERESLVAAGLLREAEFAATAECDACGDRHEEEVEYLDDLPGKPPRAFIPCPEAGRVRVDLERLRQWVVDLNGLAAYLAAALMLGGAQGDLRTGRVYLLGRRTVGRRTREVFLVRGACWGDARETVGHAPGLVRGTNPIVLVAGTLPLEATWSGNEPQVVSLASLLQWDSSELRVDQAHWASIIGGGKLISAPKTVEPFPTPPGAEWENVNLRLIDGETVVINVKDVEQRRSHVEMGMFTARGRKPTVQWKKNLQGFIEEKGKFTRKNPFADRGSERKNPKRMERLAKDLQQVFPTIPGRPIRYDEDADCWIARFTVV